ncbi:RNA polymerase sigma factor [Roseiconus lacunae]|uniref:RNA polymerase sigma factor n=1 Tax=Roseiconus lacunae TaxID=2605694 RepID=UPI0011F384C9|nr:sigma-70 family RNA polymerase sigma factor [Roseiconus lacunae]MCD0458080.1 sigma-70 family RNA polymerase sigma factor [Roseiconus lacunae]
MADHQSPSDSSGLPRETTSASGSASLDEVWNAFGSQLRRRARTRLRQYGLTGQTESMDICNEVMVDLARRSDADQLTAEDILSYILRAIDNEVVDTFRTLARHCRDFRRNESTPVEDIKLRTEQTSPSQVALRREVADRVRSILGEQDAVAVDMMLENRDWSEIGERLGVKADTARMRVRRALQRVRDEIGLRESE